MPVPNRDPVALREAYAAALYGFGSEYRRGDEFDRTLAAVCRWAVADSGYEQASVDVFTGDAPVTLAGVARSRPALDVVRTTVTAEPRQPFHTLSPFPVGAEDPEPPAAWAGATLISPSGAALGCLDLWSSVPVPASGTTAERLPILARAVMHVLDEQRRILAGRAVTAPGPRAVVDRRRGPTAEPEGGAGPG